MIKVLDREYYISPLVIERVFERNKRYYCKLKDSNEIQEISYEDYLNLGGKV